MTPTSPSRATASRRLAASASESRCRAWARVRLGSAATALVSRTPDRVAARRANANRNAVIPQTIHRNKRRLSIDRGECIAAGHVWPSTLDRTRPEDPSMTAILSRTLATCAFLLVAAPAQSQTVESFIDWSGLYGGFPPES